MSVSADLTSQVERHMRRKQIICFAVPLAIFAYLAYAHIAFDVAGLMERAKPERAQSLLADLVSYKIVATKDNRTGETEVAIEGERASVFDTPPDWVVIEGDQATVDLGEGYSARYLPTETIFSVPDYGDIRLTVSRAKGVQAVFPDGATPEWVSHTKTRFDARVDGKRLVATRSKIETHRRFWGWEEFFFTVNNPLYGQGAGQVLATAFSADRIDPARSNASFIFDSFLHNEIWIHGEVLKAIFETVLMAFLGTFIAAIIGLPLAFLAAVNFAPSKTGRFGLRRLFDFLRGVDGLIWTIVLARAFGPGPMTGSLAIALTDTGTFGKLFSEALENVDGKQIEGVAATGASPTQRYTFGVIPQLLPVLISQTLYYLESNTRSATIIGAIVGGGIGLLLTQAINTQKDWENVAYYVVLVILMVVAMDWVSGWLRRRLISGT